VREEKGEGGGGEGRENRERGLRSEGDQVVEVFLRIARRRECK
jgi:hypothetical protein